jgi:hypothetical protein
MYSGSLFPPIEGKPRDEKSPGGLGDLDAEVSSQIEPVIAEP